MIKTLLSKKTVVILRGLPGSGKTSFANILVWSSKDSVICSADHYFVKPNGNYEYDRDKLPDAHFYCKNKFLKALNKSDLIIIDNTNCHKKDMAFYEKKAKENGYQVFHVVIENRQGNKSIHDIPDERIEEMEKSFKVRLR